MQNRATCSYRVYLNYIIDKDILTPSYLRILIKQVICSLTQIM